MIAANSTHVLSPKSNAFDLMRDPTYRVACVYTVAQMVWIAASVRLQVWAGDDVRQSEIE